MIVHGHFEVNGRATNVPSMLLNVGDAVSIKEARRSRVKAIVEANQGRETPTWLEKNADAMKFQLVSTPNVEQIGLSIATNLIVEFYSR